MKRKALLMAAVTTVLWSGSYILNKLAFLGGIGPLTLSGLRYLLASLLLLGLGRRKKQKQSSPLPIRLILLLGLLGYAVAQGLQYLGQSYLTPTQSSLMLSVGNTTLVMLVDMLWLRENQNKRDLVKLLFLIAGIFMYYYPWDAGSLSAPGLLFMLASSLGYALNMTINRRMLVAKQIDARSLTAKPMLAGSVILLAAGLITEGLPVITGRLMLILAYLSIASGALGFYLWTKSQAALTAFESSGINNLMLIEIALLDFVVFNRSFSPLQIAAVLIVFASVIAIQRKPAAKSGCVHSC
jgi:drug/metabolite transporter (DMT)-like permease